MVSPELQAKQLVTVSPELQPRYVTIGLETKCPVIGVEQN